MSGVNSERGNWLLVDAESDSRVIWLSDADIMDTLKASRAKHVMAVADSCYSDSQIRAIDVVPTSDADLRRLSRSQARTVITSGGQEPVIDATRLFAFLRRKILLNAEQTRQYADIRFAGHGGGDFFSRGGRSSGRHAGRRRGNGEQSRALPLRIS